MRLALLALSFLPIAIAQSNFSGTWKLNTSLSEMRGLPAPADLILKVEQTGTVMTVAGGTTGERTVRQLGLSFGWECGQTEVRGVQFRYAGEVGRGGSAHEYHRQRTAGFSR